MKYSVIVKGFGKIKEAEIQVSPLTLFVGDNNSGKSYLLSLLWMLHSADAESPFLYGAWQQESRKYAAFKKRLEGYFYAAYRDQEEDLEFSILDLEGVINDMLEKTKHLIAASIFNDINVGIGVLEIKIQEPETFMIRKEDHGNGTVRFYYDGRHSIRIRKGDPEWPYDRLAEFAIRRMIMWVLNDNVGDSIYLPAARTGFMLSKDVINRTGRQETFGVISDTSVRPYDRYEVFTRPIIAFLNTLEELDIDHRTRYQDLVDQIEKDMTHGRVSYEELVRKEVRYLPQGQEKPISLRTTSAVVTELSPLLLILKYCRQFHEICYEEPEMCLHPKLQLEMAKLLIRMVSKGIHIIATTHSDIILQHVSNMCKIERSDISQELLEEYGLGKNDMISPGDTAVYQFRDVGDHSVVGSVPFDNGAFHVPAFTDALMDILEQTTVLQDHEG